MPIIQWQSSGELPTKQWQVAYIIIHRPTSIFTQQGGLNVRWFEWRSSHILCMRGLNIRGFDRTPRTPLPIYRLRHAGRLAWPSSLWSSSPWVADPMMLPRPSLTLVACKGKGLASLQSIRPATFSGAWPSMERECHHVGLPHPPRIS